MSSIRARLAEQPEGYRIPIGRVLAIYVGLMLVVFLGSTDQTIVATALPRIVAEIGGLSQYAWIFTAYLLAATVSIPVYGKLGDVYGKRPMLLVSVSVFLVGSALCGLARSMPVLVAFRAVQGLGAGGLVPLAMATVGSIVPLRDRGRYQGFIVAAFAGGAGVGPLLGGFIVDRSSWPWIFYVNIPFGLLALAVISTRMSNPPRQMNRPVDWAGAGMLALTSVSLMLGLLWGGREYAWGSPEIVGTLGAALCFAVAFAFVERRAVEPILPLDLLRKAAVATSVASYALGGMVMLGSITYVPLFVQGVIGQSATESGLVLWPQFLGTSVTSFFVGHWIARRGRLRPTALLGPLVLTSGMILLWRLGPGATTGEVARDTVLTGIGWGMMAQVFILSVQNAVPRSMISSATALMVFSRSMGAALGVAAMGAIVNHGLPRGTRLDPGSLGGRHTVAPAVRAVLAHAITPAFFAAACFAALILPVAAFGVRNVDLRRSVDDETPPVGDVSASTVGGSS
ncbi:MAG: drug resistance transporter, EmrB/QacA subfamily [Actinomycetia bacterium]|jgi:EmrB/QacA subfamily drug resistance transporter|nr:drug resistance transporter, EmrB/QacA subfamily [Actinomycetes bacterium]